MILTTNDIIDKPYGLNIDVYDDDTNKLIGWVNLDLVEDDIAKKLVLVVMSDSHIREDTSE